MTKLNTCNMDRTRVRFYLALYWAWSIKASVALVSRALGLNNTG